MDKKITAKHGFKLHKLNRPVIVRNINEMNNSIRVIAYQIKVNIYYKSHMKRKKKVKKKIRVIKKSNRDKQKILMEKKFNNKVKLDKEKVRKIIL